MVDINRQDLSTDLDGSPTDRPWVRSEWIDLEAPFELVQLTVNVRNALASMDYIGGSCWAAAGLVGIRARDLGYEAKWQSAACLESFHMVSSVERWLCDPTAEQFGYPGPVVCERPDWDLFFDELDPDPQSNLYGGVPHVPSLTDTRLLRQLDEFDPMLALELLSVANLERLDEHFIASEVEPRNPSR